MGTFVRGNGLQKKDFTESGVGCIHYGQIHTHYRTSATKTITFVSPGLANRLRHARTGDLVIATTSEDNEAVGKAVAWLGAEEIAVSGDAYIYRHSLDPKYVAYFFQSEQFSVQKKPHITGTKVRRLSGESLAKVRIPVPPLQVQREIVKVLDSFAELEAELEAKLEAELEARHWQNQHYHSALLSFGEISTHLRAHHSTEVQWKTLGQVAEIGTGSRNTNEELASGTYPFFVRSQEVRFMNVFEFDETAIVTSGDGVGVGKVFHFVQGKYSLHQRAYRIRIHDSALLPKFVFHFMRNGFYEYILKSAVYSSVTSVRKPMLYRYPVPIPPLDEQRRIVAILDQFDALVSDLSIGLPAELKARRQQYAYHRDRLLTFREAA